MSYTPMIVFHWNDLKPEHIAESQERRHDDPPSRALAVEIMEFLTDSKWVRDFKGQRFGYLSPEFSSEVSHYKFMLECWGVKYFEVGG